VNGCECPVRKPVQLIAGGIYKGTGSLNWGRVGVWGCRPTCHICEVSPVKTSQIVLLVVVTVYTQGGEYLCALCTATHWGCVAVVRRVSVTHTGSSVCQWR